MLVEDKIKITTWSTFNCWWFKIVL